MKNKEEMKSKGFMAFAAGKETVDSTPIVRKLYTGVGSVFVIGVNPNKDELEKIYGNNAISREPVYLSEVEIGPEGNKKKVDRIRLDFLVKTDGVKHVDKDGNPIEIISRVSINVVNSVMMNKDNTKIKMINRYGEAAWLPIENAKSGTVPESMRWFDTAEMRPALIGEEQLTKFVKAYLGIPNKTYKDRNTGSMVQIENIEDAVARFDKIQNLFKGDVSEVKKVISLQSNNKVKVLFGVTSSQDGMMYQTIYSDAFLKNGAYSYDSLKKDLDNAKAAGRYQNADFEVCDLKEYIVDKTDFSTMQSNTTSTVDDLPFEVPNDFKDFFQA